MICLTSTVVPSSPHRLPLNPRTTPFLNPISPLLALNPGKPIKRRRWSRSGLCRAELSHDAPFAAAIGACVLTSLVFPVTEVRDDDSPAALDTTDARFAVMGIISFIPYFNWLSWVFAWLDTGKRRYAFYALVYLAPYLTSNLSLSPEDSWLPIASIIFCIVHVQLEASIRNGDIQGLQMFSEAAKNLQSKSSKKDLYHEHDDHGEASEERRSRSELQSGKTQARDETRQWNVPQVPSHDQGDDDDWRVEK